MIRKNRSKILILLMTFVLVFTSTVASFGATPTKKMNVYTECIKKGNYVYCATGNGIYRVNLKNKKVLRLVKNPYRPFSNVGGMQIKGVWLYYYYDKGDNVHGLAGWVNRVTLGGKRNEKVVKTKVTDYAISGDRIYYRCYKNNKYKNESVKLNGKNARASSVRAVTKYKSTNKKEYRVKVKSKGDKYTAYLTLPRGKTVKLCTYKYYYWN